MILSPAQDLSDLYHLQLTRDSVSTCSSHHELTAALQNRVLWPANPHFCSKGNARVTGRRGQRELTLFTGKLQPSGVTSGIPVSHRGEPWALHGLFRGWCVLFQKLLAQDFDKSLFTEAWCAHSHLTGLSLQKVHFHLTLPSFPSTVFSGWWAASPVQLGRSAGVRSPSPLQFTCRAGGGYTQFWDP